MDEPDNSALMSASGYLETHMRNLETQTAEWTAEAAKHRQAAANATAMAATIQAEVDKCRSVSLNLHHVAAVRSREWRDHYSEDQQ